MNTEEKQIGTEISLQNYAGLENDEEVEVTPFDMGLIDGIEKYGRMPKVTFAEAKKQQMPLSKLVETQYQE